MPLYQKSCKNGDILINTVTDVDGPIVLEVIQVMHSLKAWGQVMYSFANHIAQITVDKTILCYAFWP